MTDKTIKLPDASRSSETLEGALAGLKGRLVAVLDTTDPGVNHNFEVVEARKDYAIVVKDLPSGRREAIHPYGTKTLYIPGKRVPDEEVQALENVLFGIQKAK